MGRRWFSGERRAASRWGSGAPAPGAHPPGAELPQIVGNRTILSLLGMNRVQTKLRVGPPGDAYEQEADRAADAVAHQLRPAVSLPADGGQIQRKCAKCEEEEEETI